MHVLRGTHESLVPRGLVLDVHPIPPSGRIVSGTQMLGRIDEREFFETVRATEAGMQAAITEGLFHFEAKVERDVIERFDTADDLIETAEEWGDIKIPARVLDRLAAAPGPIDLVENVTFRRFRAR